MQRADARLQLTNLFEREPWSRALSKGRDNVDVGKLVRYDVH